MLTRNILILCCFGCVVFYDKAASQPKQENPLLADPTIFYYDGVYYLYGTAANPNEGFIAYTSKNLVNWVNQGFILKRGEAYGNKGFWAPQVFRYRNKFYMAYTANEHISFAVAAHPLGPFTQKNKIALPTTVRAIDPFVFFDKNKVYLYHVRLNGGNKIYVANINRRFTKIKEKSLKKIIEAEDGWEDTQKVKWKVTEGPTVLKHKEIYYLIYSANDFRNADYAVGYASSYSPLGPWNKFTGNPIISTHNTSWKGTGHGDVCIDNKGRMLYVFHTHQSSVEVKLRKTAIVELFFQFKAQQPDKLSADSTTFRFIHE